MQNILKELYQKTKYNRFPISQPVHYTSVKDNNVNLNDYYISNKFDGERLIAFYVKDTLYIVNQRLELKKIEQPIEFPKDLVLDLEFTKNKRYYILDIIAGQNAYHLPFESRIKMIEKLVYSNIANHLHIKQFIDLNKNKSKALELLNNEIDNEQEKTDGYIFSKKDAFVKFGRNYNFLKWKPFDQLTVDFAFIKNVLCVLTKDGYKTICKIDDSFPDLNNNDIIECYPILNGTEITWKFKNFRLDKIKPNFVTTYLSIVEEIKLPGRKQETIDKILE